MTGFKLVSNYKPLGDQPKAINSLVKGFNNGLKHQTLLGVTGSGKTFTMANIIIVTYKILHSIFREKFFKFLIKLCSQRFIVGND